MVQIPDTNIEHQVDMLLLNAFRSNPEFVRWFVDCVGEQTELERGDQAWSAEISPPRVGPEIGQTDIGLFARGAEPTHILIENKVMSPFTYRQPERYLSECHAIVTNGLAKWAVCVLTCPKGYARRSSSKAGLFDAIIRYEEIASQLGNPPLLDAAIERCRTGWVAEEIPAVSDSFSGYAELVRLAFPRLRMKTKTKNKPMQSRTVYFDQDFSEVHHPDLPTIILNHQWQEGRAKLLFRGWGTHRTLLEPVMADSTSKFGIQVDPNRTMSLGAMVPTPVIDNLGSFDAQVDKFHEGIQAVDSLREWFSHNIDLPLSWARLIAKNTASGT